MVVIGGGVLLGLVLAAVKPDRRELFAAVPVLVAGALLGGGMAWAQRGPEPTVVPGPPTVSDAATDQALDLPYATGNLQMVLRPPLEFRSTSPDRFWTIFAGARSLPQPRCAVTGDRGAETLDLDIRCRLDEAVWSHLNTYTAFEVYGHRELSVAFSPIPDLHIPIEPSDYPVGRPSTFAFVDAERVFRVVPASSAEKGPYTQPGAGPRGADDPLTLTLFDAGVAAAELRFNAVAHAPGEYRNRLHVGPADGVR